VSLFVICELDCPADVRGAGELPENLKSWYGLTSPAGTYHSSILGPALSSGLKGSRDQDRAKGELLHLSSSFACLRASGTTRNHCSRASALSRR
jgi:hypothetical protein